MEGKLAEQQARLKNARQTAQDNSKAVMMRMSAGNDQALVSLCFSTWINVGEELKRDKEIDAAAKAAEEQYKAFMAKKRENGAGVLERMSDASDTGLIHHCFAAWQEVWKDEKAGKEMEALMQANQDKFKSLAQKQKGGAMSAASKANRLDEDNTLLAIFEYWKCAWQVARVIDHYGKKLESKGQQLEAVQTMFKSFANQLEAGIGATPRSRRTGRSKAGSEVAAPSADAPAA
jgi:hypothetical protein